MTAKPSNRQIFRYFLGGFALGAVGLLSVQGVQAEPTPAPVADTALTATR